MELIVVPGEGLIRAGGRLVAAVGGTHDAMMLSPAEFHSSAMPPARVGVVFLDDHIPDELQAHTRHTEHGASWGVHGNRAFVSAAAVSDPQGALDAMGVLIADLQAEARVALQALGGFPDPTRMTGIHLAGTYLDPKLRVPAQTVAGGQFSFTPERMCWERQYTLGIVQFLARGFDAWATSIQS